MTEAINDVSLVDGHGKRGGRGYQVSVVLPCLNELESVARCVEEASLALKGAGLLGEVIVVDNGSTDGSSGAARAAGARVIFEAQFGYGSALRTGIAAASAPVVVMADADCTYPLSSLSELVEPIVRDEADLVIANRFVGASSTMPFLHRTVGTPILSLLIRKACGGMGVRDSQSGFRAFRRSSVMELGLRATGMEFASEMLIRSAQQGLRICEVSCGYRQRVGQSKLHAFADGWRHLNLICQLAPQLLLVVPGLLMLIVGTSISLTTLLGPDTLELGSVRWQPIFFAPIFVVSGALALLGGAVTAHYSVLAGVATHKRFAFVGRAGFGRRCFLIALGSIALGLAVDAALFLMWVDAFPTVANRVALAALAQSLIMVGGVYATFSIIHRLVVAQARYPRPLGAEPVRAGELHAS